jgi:hypothetical protein
LPLLEDLATIATDNVFSGEQKKAGPFEWSGFLKVRAGATLCPSVPGLLALDGAGGVRLAARLVATSAEAQYCCRQGDNCCDLGDGHDIFRLLFWLVALGRRYDRKWRRQRKKPDRLNGPAFFKKLELSSKQTIPPSAYLLLTLVAGAGACFEAQAPRVSVAAARATTAAIFVMVMIYFASFLSWLLGG